jgi:hypothetical protein
LSLEIQKENIVFDQDLRREKDFITWAAEVLPGSMRTPTEYNFDYNNQEIIAEDGSALGKILKDSIYHAKEITKTNPQLKFELRRREIELEEYKEMVQMMNGLLPDTMVVVSDFPPELMTYPKDVSGYNVTRRQTFLRVIHRNEDGSMQMYSQTLDGSNRQALESIYRSQGFIAEDGELLGQRMHIDIGSEEPSDLVDSLMKTYDLSLKSQSGLDYRAGILVGDSKIDNTLEFVESQNDIIALANKYMSEGTFEDNRYDLIAYLEKRFNEVGENKNMTLFTTSYDSSPGFLINQAQLQAEILIAGQEARHAGKDYSGCGITSFGKSDAIGDLTENGYGNKTETSSESYSFDSYQYCVSCQAPPSSEDEKKKWCGPCGLCRDCDKKAGGKG